MKKSLPLCRADAGEVRNPPPSASIITHLIKVEEHLSAVQLVSLQTHPLVHQQLLEKMQDSQAGAAEGHDIWA